ncbi:MAG: hypothetical protein ACK6DC_22210 [Planctomycetota bacterium]
MSTYQVVGIANARWERLDPFNGNPSDPFSFNKYGFVHGDPVQGIDPTGLMAAASTGMSMGMLGGMFGLSSSGSLGVLAATSALGAYGVAYANRHALMELVRQGGLVAGSLTAGGAITSTELIAAASTITVAEALATGLLADIVAVSAQELADQAAEWAGSSSQRIRALADYVTRRSKAIAERIARELERQGRKLKEKIFFNVEDFWKEVYDVDSLRIAAGPHLMFLTYQQKTSQEKATLLNEIGYSLGLGRTPPNPGDERHEYPYASTSQAAVGISTAKWISGVENNLHGTALNGFYRRNGYFAGRNSTFLVLLVPSLLEENP